MSCKISNKSSAIDNMSSSKSFEQSNEINTNADLQSTRMFDIAEVWQLEHKQYGVILLTKYIGVFGFGTALDWTNQHRHNGKNGKNGKNGNGQDKENIG